MMEAAYVGNLGLAEETLRDGVDAAVFTRQATGGVATQVLCRDEAVVARVKGVFPSAEEGEQISRDYKLLLVEGFYFDVCNLLRQPDV